MKKRLEISAQELRQILSEKLGNLPEDVMFYASNEAGEISRIDTLDVVVNIELPNETSKDR